MDPQTTFDESEIRAAEHRLESSLQADDPIDASVGVRVDPAA
jgi:hypothetical protein